VAAFLLFFLFWGNNVDVGLKPSDAWLISCSEPFSFPRDVADVGAILSADEREIVAEDRRPGVVTKYERTQKRAIIFFPPVDSESQERYCREIVADSRRDDRIWLTHEDEFSGRFVGCDRRFVYFVAFGVELKTPRGRVIAVRWNSEVSAQ